MQFCHRQSPIRADRSGSACRAHAAVSGLHELRGMTREMYCNPISTANVWRWNISRFGAFHVKSEDHDLESRMFYAELTVS